MLGDNRHKNLSAEDKKEIMVKATSSSFSAMLVLSVLAIYIAISFFGFGNATTAPAFGLLLVACLFAALVVSSVFGPLSLAFSNLFGKIKVRKPSKKKRTKVTRANKGAEPEEAIFIGIND
jgi:multidrug efflux pump subunit AcrB